VDHIFDSASLSDAEKADILGRTAEKLLNLATQTVGAGAKQ
jgi:predicted TIM-barrel fold metal-dependent hydrolase